MITGILAAFIAAICWAISVFPFTKAGRLMTVASMNLARLIFGTLAIFIVAFINDHELLRIFSGEYVAGWGWLGASGIIALGIGDYFGLRMYTILSPRYGSVLTTLSPAMALFAGIMLLNENINLIGITVMVITITGVISLSLSRSERKNIPDHGHGSVATGIVFGIISAFCNGAGLALSKKGFIALAAVDHPVSPVTGSFMRFITACIIVLLFMLLKNKLLPNLKNITAQPASILKMVAAGILFGPLLAVSMAMTAIQYINVAVAQTIFALVPVIALIISRFVYKEKISTHAMAGAVAAIAGVVILIWRQDINLLFG
jgi:drug/metabolite transporter (DMT)-like permease